MFRLRDKARFTHPRWTPRIFDEKGDQTSIENMLGTLHIDMTKFQPVARVGGNEDLVQTAMQQNAIFIPKVFPAGCPLPPKSALSQPGIQPKLDRLKQLGCRHCGLFPNEEDRLERLMKVLEGKLQADKLQISKKSQNL